RDRRRVGARSPPGAPPPRAGGHRGGPAEWRRLRCVRGALIRDRRVTGSASSAAYGRKMRVAAGADGTWWAAADAPREGDYHCPSCGAELALRSAPVLAPHYAHPRPLGALPNL